MEAETEDYSQDLGHEQIPELRDNFITNLTNTNKRYLNLWYQLRGYAPDGKGNWKKGKELCGEEFANKTVAEFSAVVNDTNSLTKKSEKEVKRILKDAVEVFLMDSYYEETIEDTDIPVLSKIYEHNLELFLGLVENGHGSRVITAILTGQKLELAPQQQDNNLFFRGGLR
jgi:hypothetical protein